MDANFSKFKKRIWLFIGIKCALAGLAASLAAVCAVLLPCRLCGVNLFWLIYAGIAVAFFALGGGLAFLFLRTDDKKIAKLLDTELGLQERVITAYEYGGQQSVMLEMQRESARGALAGVSLSALPFKNVVATVLCAAVAACGVVAVPVITACIPVRAESAEEEPDEPPRQITDWEWTALDDLIAYVKNSKKADAVAKTGMLLSLEGLKSVILNGVSQSSLTAFVENAATGVSNAVKEANGRDGVSEVQQSLNSEEGRYVVSELYRIFSLNKPGNSGGNSGDPSGGEDDPSDPGATVTPPGGLNVNDTPFFDPERGYVKCGDVRTEYYEKLQQALQEGVISQEEWEHIVIAYFADLSANNN